MVAKRSIALLIDMILINLCWVVYSLVMIPILMKKGFDSVLCVLIYFAIAFVLMLAKDAVRGMSVGKFIVGIQVVDSKTGKPIGLWQSALRNSLLYIFAQLTPLHIISDRVFCDDLQFQRSSFGRPSGRDAGR